MLLESLGLPTIAAREFYYQDKKQVIEFARAQGKFNLRTDSSNSQPYNTDLPFKKDCSIDHLKYVMAQNKDALTYIIFEAVDDAILYFNGQATLDSCRQLHAYVNKTDKTSLRKAMANGKNVSKLDVPPDEDPALRKIRGDMISCHIYDMSVEFSVFLEGNDFRYVYWQILDLKYPRKFQYSGD